MLDRESACNRVFLAPSLCSVRRRWRWASVRACSFVFKLAAAPRSTMSSPLPYCRTSQTSSDVGVIGMITASARCRWTCRRQMEPSENSSMISRARACACAQGGARSESFSPAACAEDWPGFVATLKLVRSKETGWPVELDLACRWYAPHLERRYQDARMREADLLQLAQIASTYPNRQRFVTELTLD